MSVPTRLYGILGKPLGQSMSPSLHNWGFSASGFPGAYFSWEKSPEDLSAFMASIRTLPIDGLSVTIPYKQAIMPFLDGISSKATTVGAVNTLFWHDGQLIGDNTDVTGFMRPLRSMEGPLPAKALVLGAGGASRAVLCGLKELGVEQLFLSARSANKMQPLAQQFQCKPVAWEERSSCLETLGQCLVINTTPLGMQGKFEGQAPLTETGLASLPHGSIVYDIVYNPVDTPLLTLAKERCLTCINGLDFFVSQGVEQFRLWTGISLPYGKAYDLVYALLNA